MKLSIIGATGLIGSSAAFNIAVNGLADEIVLISRRPDLADHHASDIQTSIVGRVNTLLRAGVTEDLVSSDVVIITAGVTPRSLPSQRDYLLANVPIIRQAGEAIVRYCPEAVVITVTNPVDIINYALYSFTKLKSSQLIGYSLNDTLRFRRLIARVLKINTERVHAIVIGAHLATQVPLFSSITVDGESFIADESFISNVRAVMSPSTGEKKKTRGSISSPWTSGIGLTDIVRAIRNDNATLIPCSVVLDGEFGYQGMSIGVPAIIGHEGVKQIEVCQLSTEEESELRKSAAYIREGIDYVAETFRL